MMNEDGYHHLLSAIYDLALAPADWPIVLRLLAEVLNCSCAASITTTPERDTPDPAILVDAFDLTPSEAILAADLLSGLSVGEAAAKRRRSITTMLTHLASVLAKTGTARQSNLVRPLSQLPLTTRALV
jgi:DNA-binding CsgD family transcriptional regulator